MNYLLLPLDFFQQLFQKISCSWQILTQQLLNRVDLDGPEKNLALKIFIYMHLNTGNLPLKWTVYPCLRFFSVFVLYRLQPYLCLSSCPFVVEHLQTELLETLHACLSSKAASNSPFQTIWRCMKIFTQQREWGRHIFQPDLCFSTRSRTEWRTESQLCSTCPAPDPFWPSVRRGSARPTLRLTCWSWGKALSTGTMWKSVILNAHWLRAVQLKLPHINTGA